MDPNQAFLLAHIACGFSALTTGIVPMIARKGGKSHKFWGNVYYWSMVGVCVTTLGMFALRPAEFRLQFFLCIAVLSFYFTFSGDRVLRMKKSATQATVSDRVAAGLALACGLAMLGYAAYSHLVLHNSMIAVLFGIFGTVIGFEGRRDLRLFSGRADSEKMHWYFGHISKIMGAYTATLTAFCVNMGRYLPENLPAYARFIPWLVPAVLLGVGTSYYAKRQREKRKMAVTYGPLTKVLRWMLVKNTAPM